MGGCACRPSALPSEQTCSIPFNQLFFYCIKSLMHKTWTSASSVVPNSLYAILALVGSHALYGPSCVSAPVPSTFERHRISAQQWTNQLATLTPASYNPSADVVLVS